MNFIVLDLEWNQCPSGKEHEEPLLPFEIIAIGAVKAGSGGSDTFYETVRPQVYPALHPIIREVTCLEDGDLADRRAFHEVVRDFLAWCGEDPLFCTWGSQDLLELQRNMQWHRIPSPLAFPLFYYDLQKIFSIVYEDRKSQRALEYAVDYFRIPKKEAFHNALSDALYAAKVMEHLKEADILANSSIDYFRTPQNRRQEIHVTYGTYSKFVSRPFSDKAAAMKDRVVTSTRCYLCHRNTRKKIRWFSSGSRNYYCLSLCEAHGWLKGKIRMRQHADGSFYVIKTQKLIGDEEAYAIKEKQEIQRLKRRLKRTFQAQSAKRNLPR